MSENVLITGASAGFGRLISRTLVEIGYSVFATMREPDGRNIDRAASLHDFAADKNGRLHVLELDVTSDESVDRAISAAIDLEGPLDVVVNNAGIGSGGLGECFTSEQWIQIFDVNVFGVQRVMRAALPSMRARGTGLVVNISSIMGRVVIPFATPYTATKFALEGLSESYRYELSGTGVDVCIVEPGGFLTETSSRMLAPDDTGRAAAYGPVGKLPGRVWGPFAAKLSADDAPDPQRLADAVVELIETPAGKRPLRRVVDPLMGGCGTDSLNSATDRIQERVLDLFGARDLMSVRET